MVQPEFFWIVQNYLAQSVNHAKVEKPCCGLLGYGDSAAQTTSLCVCTQVPNPQERIWWPPSLGCISILDPVNYVPDLRVLRAHEYRWAVLGKGGWEGLTWARCRPKRCAWVMDSLQGTSPVVSSRRDFHTELSSYRKDVTLWGQSQQAANLFGLYLSLWPPLQQKIYFKICCLFFWLFSECRINAKISFGNQRSTNMIHPSPHQHTHINHNPPLRNNHLRPMSVSSFSCIYIFFQKQFSYSSYL